MPGIESRAPERTETSSGFFDVAELLAGLLLDRGDAGLHLRLERRRIRPLVVVVVGADLGGDGEAGRHRQADAAHLGEVGALAAEQRLHAAVAVGLRLAEQIDVLPPWTELVACAVFFFDIYRSDFSIDSLDNVQLYRSLTMINVEDTAHAESVVVQAFRPARILLARSPKCRRCASTQPSSVASATRARLPQRVDRRPSPARRQRTGPRTCSASRTRVTHRRNCRCLAAESMADSSSISCIEKRQFRRLP